MLSYTDAVMGWGELYFEIWGRRAPEKSAVKLRTLTRMEALSGSAPAYSTFPYRVKG